MSYLTKKRVNYKWTEECETNFKILKERLLNPPVLKYPDFEKLFIITVDASATGCGAVLSQLHGDDDLPIAFISKAWSPADAVKSTPIQECLGIHLAISQFGPYIYGTSFLVRTDHKSLVYLFTHKNLSPKLLRIRLDLEDYDFTIEHVSGKKNVVADALSRIHMKDIVDLYGKTASVLAITRSMSKKIDENTQVNDHSNKIVNNNELLEDVPMIENLSAKMIKKVPKLRCTMNEMNGTIELNMKVHQESSGSI